MRRAQSNTGEFGKMKTIKKYLKQTFKELFRNYFYKYFIIGAALSIGITVTSLVAYSISATFDSGNVLTSGDLKQLKDAITKNSPPVGSIIALHKDMTGGTPPLETPLGDWVECNGQILSDASSPYNGQKIPNLKIAPHNIDIIKKFKSILDAV